MLLKNYAKAVIVFCILRIIMIKYVIRPHVHIPGGLQVIVDIAPNLLGSFMLPFGVSWLLDRYFRIQALIDLKLVCLLCLVVIFVNEYLQLISVFGRTFDYFDIIASFISTATAYFVYARLAFNIRLADQL
ncbi:hypothetical protein BH10BAC2_BH10BAC2_34730 [soil metagenome]